MFTKIKQVIIVFSSGAILLAAAGCTGNASPAEPANSSPASTATATGTPPSASQSPTRKPSPSPVPASSKGPAKNWPVPKMPDAAKRNSKAGIIAFTEHYFDLVDYAVLTYDTKPLKAATERTCYLCAKQIIDPADGNRGHGGWHAGGKTDVTVTFARNTKGNSISGFTFLREETSVYLPDGKLQSTIPAITVPRAGTLNLIFNDGWSVVDVEFIDPGGK
jgi:hypothetical protein